jgi:hypothetical protein
MPIVNVEKVLREARKLPPRDQDELVKSIMSDMFYPSVKKRSRSAKKNALEILSGMSAGELKALANAILVPHRQRRLRSLLHKNKMQALNEKEFRELDQILEDCDRIALLKAKAEYTLSISKHAKGRAV